MAWFAGSAIVESLDRFDRMRGDGIEEVARYVQRISTAEDLVLTFERSRFTYGFFLERNVIPNCRQVELPAQAIGYLMRHPNARLIYVLLPAFPDGAGALPTDHVQYLEARRQLDALARPKTIAGYRIYDLARGR